MGTTLGSPTTHIALEVVDVSPALGLFLQAAQLSEYFWCERNMFCPRLQWKKNLPGEMEGPLLTSRLRKRT